MARADVEARGLVSAGWRIATGAALVATAAALLVWLRGYLETRYLPMLPVLGAASLVTFLVAAVGYPAAALLWLTGRARPARIAAIVAGVAWVLTAVVFQLLMGGSLRFSGEVDAAQSALLAWTLLAMLGLAATRQPAPRARTTWLAIAATVIVGAAVFARGGVRLGAPSGYYAILEAGPDGWLPSALQRGPLDTLHTAVLVGWALLLLVGLAAWVIDRRLVVAALWLAPFVVLSQVRGAGPGMIAVGLAVIVAVVGIGSRQARAATA